MVDCAVPWAPEPVVAGGKTVLVYELHVTNLQSRDVTLATVQVFGDAATSPLVTYEGAELNGVLNRPGLARPAEGAPPPDRRVIGPGMRAIVRVWATTASAPKTLRHRIVLEYVDASGAKQTSVVDAFTVAVNADAAPVLDAPFRDGTWVAGNGPSNFSDHRRSLIPIEGRARIAQRFAIDWLELGQDGKPYHGDPSKNASWYGYGKEVLAVADGVVTATKDGIPDGTPLSPDMAVPITAETAAGNCVILDIGRGRYALFAHLQPGSLKVKVGDRVRRGQVLGLLGNSGNSDAPHLHFHVADANSPLAAEGVPFELRSFEVVGTYANEDDVVEGKPWSAAPDGTGGARSNEIPTRGEVVRFGKK